MMDDEMTMDAGAAEGDTSMGEETSAEETSAAPEEETAA